MDSMDSNRQKDKSWGMVGFYRIHGSGRELFGSDVSNHDSIRLSIKHAVKHRDLGRDWNMGDDLICEVELSALQFAELLTNMNVGDGVPCTIRFTREDGHVEYRPERSKLEIIQAERGAEIDEASSYLQEAISELSALIDNKKIPKTVGSELLHKLKVATSNLEGSNYNFYRKQALTEIDHMVVEAKSQISEHINHKIYSVGLEHLLNAADTTPTLNGSSAKEAKDCENTADVMSIESSSAELTNEE